MTKERQVTRQSGAPLIVSTLKPFADVPPAVGYYDEQRETWSVRDWQCAHASPKKLNQEA